MTSPTYAVIVYTTSKDALGATRKALQQRIKADIEAGLPVILPAGWSMFIVPLPQGKVEPKVKSYGTPLSKMPFKPGADK